MQQEYQPELATLELVIEVKRLLATERRVERLICRYLADLADRIRERLDTVLWAYADELHAARCIFGLGVRDTRARVRVGRALRRLPRVEAAFINGEVSYSRVRELTRVAEPSTETEWLAPPACAAGEASSISRAKVAPSSAVVPYPPRCAAR